MEIGSIIIFNGQNWLIEDIKHIDNNKDILILSKTDLIETDLPSITNQPCQCSKCGWTGIVWDTESIDDDGNLGCPECSTVIEVLE